MAGCYASHVDCRVQFRLGWANWELFGGMPCEETIEPFRR